jgi:DNA repair exonuclease SbcCD nuclease subunit
VRPLSFVHLADLHLGYAQYNLETRREDFSRVFEEAVDKTIDLKPDFMIIAGDIFHHARPSNVTLEAAIRSFRDLKNAGIPVLCVDGSHDAAPNTVTGTVLNPLDAAGLIYYLPRHDGACWRDEKCYVYGVPNYRTRRKTDEQLPLFYGQNPPTPDPDLFNIFTFHMALDLPSITPPHIEAEASPDSIPGGFNYYAGGHVHQPSQMQFNVLEADYTGMTPARIGEEAARQVGENDEAGAIIVPVLEGTLPAEANRSEIDVARIRSAAEKALLVRPVIRLRETEISEEVVRSIFEGELKDLKTKAFEYFLQIFSERYSRDEAERITRLSLNIMEPLTRKDPDHVKAALEAHLDAN